MILSVFLKTVCFWFKVRFKLQKISVRSKNWCLTIPKLVPDYPKNGAWRSQKWCLTIVRHHFWDFFWDPNNDAWRLAVQKSTYQLATGHQASLLGYQKRSQNWCLSVNRNIVWHENPKVVLSVTRLTRANPVWCRHRAVSNNYWSGALITGNRRRCHSTALHCTKLHCTALYCTDLHCTELHCTPL